MEKFRTAWDGAQRQFSASLRPLQAREFECMAGCARQSGLSDEEYEACFKRCGTALARISDTYTREVTLFQNQVELCVQNCSSAAQAKMPPNASAVPPEIESELQTCIGRCEADVLAKIPQFFARLQEVVNQAK